MAASAPATTKSLTSNGLVAQPVCRYFLNGSCRYGDECKFSHDISSSNQQVCHFYRLGKCKNGSTCRFLHADEKKLAEKPCNSKKITPESGACAYPTSAPAAKWAEAAEFIPGKKYTPRFTDESYSSALKTNLQHCNKLADESFCILAAEGRCLNGDSCPLVHGLLCSMCNLYLLHPTDKEQQEKHKQMCLKYIEEDMEDSFKIAKTNQLVCGICMEKVSEKANPSERRFGILENCMHVFCLECIRKWRSADNFQKKVVKSCPECRVASSFVTPSGMWLEDPEEKKKLIDSYKDSLSKKPCKYFDKGRGKCPFGRYCFYMHAYPDGSKQDKSKLPPRRSVLNEDGEYQELSMLQLSELLEQERFAVLESWLDDDDDEVEFYNAHDYYDLFDSDDSDDLDYDYDDSDFDLVC